MFEGRSVLQWDGGTSSNDTQPSMRHNISCICHESQSLPWYGRSHCCAVALASNGVYCLTRNNCKAADNKLMIAL